MEEGDCSSFHAQPLIRLHTWRVTSEALVDSAGLLEAILGVNDVTVSKERVPHHHCYFHGNLSRSADCQVESSLSNEPNRTESKTLPTS